MSMVRKQSHILCEHGEETPWHLFRECPHPMVHNQLPPDSWETDELLRLINKTKFLEVLNYSDLQFQLHPNPLMQFEQGLYRLSLP